MRFLILLTLTLFYFGLPSCTAVTKVSGYMPLKTEIDQLVVGSTTMKEAVKILGEPLSTSKNSPNVILYVQQRAEALAFFKPRVSERTVLKLIFDQNDILASTSSRKDVDALPINLEQQIVVSEGREITLWQQLFGNIGNFSAEQFLE